MCRANVTSCRQDEVLRSQTLQMVTISNVLFTTLNQSLCLWEQFVVCHEVADQVYFYCLHGAIQVLRNAMVGVSFPGKKHYEGVRINVISVTRGWGPNSLGKCYITLEWPLCDIVGFVIFLLISE